MSVVPFPRASIDAILGPVLAPGLTPAQRRLAVEHEIAGILPELDHIGADRQAYRLRACALALVQARDEEEQPPAARKRMAWWRKWL